jgi:hypothetical protein
MEQLIKWSRFSLRDRHYDRGDFTLFILVHGAHYQLVWDNGDGNGDKGHSPEELAMQIRNAGLALDHKNIQLLACGAGSSPGTKNNVQKIQTMKDGKEKDTLRGITLSMEAINGMRRRTIQWSLF